MFDGAWNKWTWWCSLKLIPQVKNPWSGQGLQFNTSWIMHDITGPGVARIMKFAGEQKQTQTNFAQNSYHNWLTNGVKKVLQAQKGLPWPSSEPPGAMFSIQCPQDHTRSVYGKEVYGSVLYWSLHSVSSSQRTLILGQVFGIFELAVMRESVQHPGKLCCLMAEVLLLLQMILTKFRGNFYETKQAFVWRLPELHLRILLLVSNFDWTRQGRLKESSGGSWD